MKIYDWFDGPYPARVRIALAEKGLLSRIEFVPVNLWTGEHKKPAFLAINYSGTLPVLELDDGTLIAECTAITQYLDVLDGNPLLTGRTPAEKGIIHMMTKRAGLGPDVELYQNREWVSGCATRPCAGCTISTAFWQTGRLWRATNFRWPTSRYSAT